MRDMLQGVAAVLPPAVARAFRGKGQKPAAVSAALNFDRPGLATCRSPSFRSF